MEHVPPGGGCVGDRIGGPAVAQHQSPVPETGRGDPVGAGDADEDVAGAAGHEIGDTDRSAHEIIRGCSRREPAPHGGVGAQAALGGDDHLEDAGSRGPAQALSRSADGQVIPAVPADAAGVQGVTEQIPGLGDARDVHADGGDRVKGGLAEDGVAGGAATGTRGAAVQHIDAPLIHGATMPQVLTWSADGEVVPAVAVEVPGCHGEPEPVVLLGPVVHHQPVHPEAVPDRGRGRSSQRDGEVPVAADGAAGGEMDADLTGAGATVHGAPRVADGQVRPAVTVEVAGGAGGSLQLTDAAAEVRHGADVAAVRQRRVAGLHQQVAHGPGVQDGAVAPAEPALDLGHGARDDRSRR